MINLRYHIVSIVAVFLALGIGITMGSTFLGKATVDQIDKNVRNAREEVRQTRAENERLKAEVSQAQKRADDLTDQAVPRSFTAYLPDVPVVVIAAPGVDQKSLDDVREALRTSGAVLEGTITPTGKLALEGSDAGALAEVLDSKSANPASLRRQVTSAVAAELLAAAEQPKAETPSTTTTAVPTTPPPTVPGDTAPATTTTTAPATTTTVPPSSPELISSLIAEGYLDYEPAPGGATADELLQGQGYLYVVVTGPDPDLSDDLFLQPLLAAMAAEGPAPVVVVSAATGDDPEATRDAALAPFIDDDVIGDRVSTVDDLESYSGVAATIMALQDLQRGRRGHYGVGEGAKSQVPPTTGSG